jgi:hypothetical protein
MTLPSRNKKRSRALYLSEIEICCKFSVNCFRLSHGQGAGIMPRGVWHTRIVMAVYHENILCLDEV